MVPISLEGGEKKGHASWRSNNVKPFIRRRSSSLGLKQGPRKGSRTNLITVQVQIQLDSFDKQRNQPQDSKTSKNEVAMKKTGQVLPVRVVPQLRRPAPSRTITAGSQPLSRPSSLKNYQPTNKQTLVNKPVNTGTRVKPEMMDKQNSPERKPIAEVGLLEKILTEPVRKTSLKNFGKEPVTSQEEPVIFKSSLIEPISLHLTLTKPEPDNLPKDGIDFQKCRQALITVESGDNEEDDNQLSGPRLSLETPADSFSTIQQECLDSHNKCRAKHGVKPLRLNQEICEYSQKWAEKLASSELLEHSGSHQYGENLYYCWNSDPKVVMKGNEPVESWYSEVKTHKYGGKPRTNETGHFTQVVWKDTKELGVGVAKSKSGKVFVVTNYSPPGNFIGKYKENVPRRLQGS